MKSLQRGIRSYDTDEQETKYTLLPPGKYNVSKQNETHWTLARKG